MVGVYHTVRYGGLMAGSRTRRKQNEASKPSARLSRSGWIRAALDALMEKGVDGLSVETLARKLGVTKGSFYWHFEDRKALLDAVLKAWEEEGTGRVIQEVDERVTDPIERLKALARRTFKVTPFDRLEGAMRAWATQNEAARATVKRVDKRRLGYVTQLLVGAGVPRATSRRRAEVFYRTLIGEFAYRSSGGKALSIRAVDEVIDSVLLADVAGVAGKTLAEDPRVEVR